MRRRRRHPVWGSAAAAVLLSAAGTMAFPLTQSLGNSGSREFHFCRLEVTPRAVACGGAVDCLQFDSANGPVWLNVHSVASLSETAPGMVLLQDMFQFASQLTVIGDRDLIAQITPRTDASPVGLRGYWYPSGRRLFLLEVRSASEH